MFLSRIDDEWRHNTAATADLNSSGLAYQVKALDVDFGVCARSLACTGEPSPVELHKELKARPRPHQDCTLESCKKTEVWISFCTTMLLAGSHVFGVIEPELQNQRASVTRQSCSSPWLCHQRRTVLNTTAPQWELAIRFRP